MNASNTPALKNPRVPPPSSTSEVPDGNMLECLTPLITGSV
jgi:hypothetical protein